MPNTEPKFLCLDDPDISQFVNQDFDVLPANTTKILSIHAHQIHVSRNPTNGSVFDIAVFNTQHLSRQILAEADSHTILPIITRIAEAVVLGYISHAAIHADENCCSIPE